jgi:hypothetical protein
LTARGAIVGTPYFMAPEQLRGEALDGRTDQFAWGVMAYMLLTGAGPWKEGGAPVAVLAQIASFAPPPPRAIAAEVPEAVSAAIMRAMAKERSARFETMESLVAALEGGGASTPASSSSVEAGPRGRARLAIRWGIAVALLAGVSARGWASWRANDARRASLAEVGTPSGAEGGACRSNRDCARAHPGSAWHCHSERHVCVEVASPDCTAFAAPEASEADDVVWVGGLFPLSDGAQFLPEARAAELAEEDFARALGSSAERTGAMHARPIGLVVCDEAADAARAARHLADDVEVPAVVGFRSTSSALAVIPAVFLPKRILSFISVSQAPELTKIPQPAGEARLVWRSTLNTADATTPLAHLISDVLEPSARSGRAGQSGIGDRPFRVAVALPKGWNHTFVESLFRELEFNHRSALENGSNFRQFVYEGELRDAAALDADAGAGDLVDALLRFAPDAIVFGGRAFFPNVLVPLEARWRGGPRPFYLSQAGFPADALAAFAGRDASRRRRFLADTNLTTTMTNAELVLRYNRAFPSEPVDRSEAPQPSYDAFFVLAYATYALADRAVTGPALAEAMDRLRPSAFPAPKVDVGAAGILEAFSTLRSAPDARIDLNGAIGGLDFEPSTGEAPIDYAILCPGVGDDGVASALVESGLVYVASAKKFTGALRCP